MGIKIFNFDHSIIENLFENTIQLRIFIKIHPLNTANINNCTAKLAAFSKYAD